MVEIISGLVRRLADGAAALGRVEGWPRPPSSDAQRLPKHCDLPLKTRFSSVACEHDAVLDV